MDPALVDAPGFAASVTAALAALATILRTASSGPPTPTHAVTRAATPTRAEATR